MPRLETPGYAPTLASYTERRRGFALVNGKDVYLGAGFHVIVNEWHWERRWRRRQTLHRAIRDDPMLARLGDIYIYISFSSLLREIYFSYFFPLHERDHGTLGKVVTSFDDFDLENRNRFRSFADCGGYVELGSAIHLDSAGGSWDLIESDVSCI